MGELELRLEQHRRELTGYCYRMLVSSFEADLRVTGVDDGAQVLALSPDFGARDRAYEQDVGVPLRKGRTDSGSSFH